MKALRLLLRSFPWLCAIAAVAAPLAGVGQITPYGCVEYLPNTNPAVAYVARFSYINTFSTSAYIPINTQLNSFSPYRSKFSPSTFGTGNHFESSAILVGQGYSETWRIDEASLTLSAIGGAVVNSGAVTPTAVCPVVLVPSALNYTSTGTYQNVYLGQVNSGPDAPGVTLTAQPSTGITVSNLVYKPLDAASPLTAATGEPNPNSIYGTVTVASGAATNSSIVLAFNAGGITNAQTIVPLTFTPPAYSITGTAANASQPRAGLTVASGSTLPISLTFTYSGQPNPTGSISVLVDGSGYGLSNLSCTYVGNAVAPRQTCTISYFASGPAASHTLTYGQAADSNFASFSGTATIQVTSPAIVSQ